MMASAKPTAKMRKALWRSWSVRARFSMDGRPSLQKFLAEVVGWFLLRQYSCSPLCSICNILWISVELITLFPCFWARIGLVFFVDVLFVENGLQRTVLSQNKGEIGHVKLFNGQTQTALFRLGVILLHEIFQIASSLGTYSNHFIEKMCFVSKKQPHNGLETYFDGNVSSAGNQPLAFRFRVDQKIRIPTDVFSDLPVNGVVFFRILHNSQFNRLAQNQTGKARLQQLETEILWMIPCGWSSSVKTSAVDRVNWWWDFFWAAADWTRSCPCKRCSEWRRRNSTSSTANPGRPCSSAVAVRCLISSIADVMSCIWIDWTITHFVRAELGRRRGRGAPVERRPNRYGNVPGLLCRSIWRMETSRGSLKHPSTPSEETNNR